jgi:hypothetical protein
MHYRTLLVHSSVLELVLLLLTFVSPFRTGRDREGMSKLDNAPQQIADATYSRL